MLCVKCPQIELLLWTKKVLSGWNYIIINYFYGFDFAFLWWAGLATVDTSLVGRDQSLSSTIPCWPFCPEFYQAYHKYGASECHCFIWLSGWLVLRLLSLATAVLIIALNGFYLCCGTLHPTSSGTMAMFDTAWLIHELISYTYIYIIYVNENF